MTKQRQQTPVVGSIRRGKTRMKQPSVVEKIAGHPITEGALTLVGALSGGPVAALLPILSGTLASGRQFERIADAIKAIEATLAAHDALLRDMSDAKYKLVNEAILGLLHTTDSDKVAYLRTAVGNSLTSDDLEEQEAVMLGRLLRDISAAEAAFLLKNRHYRRIQFWDLEKNDNPNEVFVAKPDTPDGMIVAGLVSLGLLLGTSNIGIDLGRFSFAPIAAWLVALLEPAAAAEGINNLEGVANA